MIFEELPAFTRDMKSLGKKYRSLDADLVITKKTMVVSPDAKPPFSYRIADLGLQTCVIKVKKIACQSLKGRGVNSGLRLVYAWFELEERIVLIEIYHKAEKEVEDRERILVNFV